MKRVFALVGFSFAAVLFILNMFGYGFAHYAAVFFAAAFLVSVAVPKCRHAGAVPVCMGTAVLACLLFLFSYSAFVVPQLALADKTADTLFCLTNLGEKTVNGYVYTAKVVSCDLAGAPQSFKIRLFSPQQIPAEGYQLLKAKLKFRATGEGFESFGLWGKDIFLKASVKYYTPTYEYFASPMRNILHIRYDITDYFLDKVGGDEGALSIGMILGDRSYISDELLESFQLTGTSHLTAVSGLHLSAVTGVFAYLFRRLGVSKKFSAPVLICLIVFYCMLSGFSKSVIRAAVMLCVLLIGEMFGERADSINSLGLAMLIICVNPFAVCDMSTLLTALCVLAIVAVYPHYKHKAYAYKLYLRTEEKERKIKLSRGTVEALFSLLDMFLLSASITVCTLPVMAMFFGCFSLIGIFLNVIIVPLGSIAVSLSFISTVFSKVLVIRKIFALLVTVMNKALIAIIKACANVPFASLNLSFVFVFALGAVLLLIAVSIIFAPKLVKKTAFISVFVFMISVFAFNVYDSTCSHIYVKPGGTVVLSENGRESSYSLKNEFTAELDGVTISSCKNADIIVGRNAIKDERGTVSVSEGGVIYSVKNGRYYAYRYY